jgi:hypothetical protein
LLIEWWQNKLAEVLDDRKTVNRNVPAVAKQSIAVTFIRNEYKVYLVIPPIRLNDERSKLLVDVYASDKYIMRREELHTKMGEFMVTTKQKEIDLDELFQDSEPIKIRVKITEAEKVIYDKTFERDFILFERDNEILSQINKVNNYFVYSRDVKVLQTPTGIYRCTSNLYNIYPKAGETLSGASRNVFFTDKANAAGNNNAVYLLGNIPGCEWRSGDISHIVFGGQVCLLISNEIAVNGMTIVINAERILVSELVSRQEENYRVFNINDYIPKYKPLEISVYSHLKEKQIINENIIIFPNLNVVFAKVVFYGNDDKKLTISIDDKREILSWDNTQNEVVYPLNDGNLIIKIPYTRWRINCKEWQNEPFNKKAWYKKYFDNGSLLEIESAVDVENVKLFALIDGQTESVERNKTSGKFEIGKYIFSHEYDKREIKFFVSHSDKVIEIELFIVAIKEHFISTPLVYSDGKLLWQSEDNFIGDEKRRFQANFYRMESETSVKDLTFRDDEIKVLDEGIYKVKIVSQEKGLFKKENQCFYDGEIVVGSKEKFRFENKRIKIISASVELSADESCTDYWKPFRFGYYIDKVEFVEQDRQKFYLGRLYTFDKFGGKKYLNEMNKIS